MSDRRRSRAGGGGGGGEPVFFSGENRWFAYVERNDLILIRAIRLFSVCSDSSFP